MKKKPLPKSDSFSWDIVNINPKTKERTLKNKATGQEWTISKERYLQLVKEQEANK